MNRQQAQEILSVYRPGTADERDPMFAEALALARADAELKSWFEESVAFDRGMRAALARVDAPVDLRDLIVAGQTIVRPVAWWNRKLTGPQMAAAAAVVILASLGTLWAFHKPTSFAEFRREIADQSWGPAPHIEFKASNLAEVRQILATHEVSTNFSLPPTLAQADIRGCSLMRWRGQDVPMICFHSARQHLHLVVVDRNQFPDAPGSAPQADQWAVWQTASWSQDSHSYVLTGLKAPAFVKKFRKGGRWDWEG